MEAHRLTSAMSGEPFRSVTEWSALRAAAASGIAVALVAVVVVLVPGLQKAGAGLLAAVYFGGLLAAATIAAAWTTWIAVTALGVWLGQLLGLGVFFVLSIVCASVGGNLGQGIGIALVLFLPIVTVGAAAICLLGAWIGAIGTER